MTAILPYIEIVLAVLLVTAILLQQSEAGAGSAFGGGDSFGSGGHTRRGFEKFLFYSTIILAILFALATFLTLLIVAR